MECQFERNLKFKSDINLISADELRSQPIGKDKLGNAYWSTMDTNLNLRIYQEHLDEDIWKIVANNRDELVQLIACLKGNDMKMPSLVGLVDEDSSSNSMPAPPKIDALKEKEQKMDNDTVMTEQKTANGGEQKTGNISIVEEQKVTTNKIVDLKAKELNNVHKKQEEEEEEEESSGSEEEAEEEEEDEEFEDDGEDDESNVSEIDETSQVASESSFGTQNQNSNVIY